MLEDLVLYAELNQLFYFVFCFDYFLGQFIVLLFILAERFSQFCVSSIRIGGVHKADSGPLYLHHYCDVQIDNVQFQGFVANDEIFQNTIDFELEGAFVHVYNHVADITSLLFCINILCELSVNIDRPVI